MEGFENQINRLMDLTAYQVARMKEQSEKFYLLFDTPGKYFSKKVKAFPLLILQTSENLP